jgi:TRAP-type C4-dicarboxylate transport system substrate-binding protein
LKGWPRCADLESAARLGYKGDRQKRDLDKTLGSWRSEEVGMNRNWITPFALVVSLLLLSGVWAGATEQSVRLSFATTMDDSGVDRAIREFFDERVRELSGGSIEIDFFMGGQLGGEREALEQMKLGELDMGYNVIQAELYYPEYNAVSIPFLFPDFASMQAFMSGSVGDEVARLARERGGIIPLGMHGYGARWTTSNRPFTTPEELRGLTIRMPEIRWWVDVWAEMGALPTPIAATEIVTALQTGVVEAQENFLTNIAGRQMWEYQRYLIKTEHIQFFQTWLVSERTWEDKLSEAQRQALAQAVEDTIAYVAEIVDEMNEGFVEETIANGMVLIEPDQEALRAAALPAVTRIIEEDLAPGVYDEVLEVIGQED